LGTNIPLGTNIQWEHTMIIRPRVSMLFFTALLFAFGCASTVDVNVNSIVDPELTPAGKRYVLNSGEKNQDDLFFREFSRYFDAVLQDAGYIKTDNWQEADLEIVFEFGISDGRTGVYSFASPIYDFVGGETITITEKTSDPSGQKVTTITIPARLQRVGTSIETRSYTMFNRTAALEARMITKRAADQPDMESELTNPPVWGVYIYSIGESNDLRQIMPYLAAAAAPYIGINTGQLITVKLKPEDPLVRKLKGSIVNQSKP
jgi:hypothetical protein